MRALLRPVARLRLAALAAVVPPCLALVVAAGLSGCQTYRDELSRSQRAFEHADYERALSIFRLLEPEVATRFSVQEQAQYAYLRGMTDYRIGYKVDARHWLAVAHAIDESGAGILPKDWKGRMQDTLGELDEQVYTEGIEALTESQEGAAKTAPAPSAKPKSEDEP